MQTVSKKKLPPPPPQNATHPKYRIAEFIRNKFGELAFNTGIKQLAQHCNIKRKQTVADWLQIEAGSKTEISHLAMPFVLSFFQIQNENQLLTQHHKQMLKQANTHAA